MHRRRPSALFGGSVGHVSGLIHRKLHSGSSGGLLPTGWHLNASGLVGGSRRRRLSTIDERTRLKHDGCDGEHQLAESVTDEDAEGEVTTPTEHEIPVVAAILTVVVEECVTPPASATSEIAELCQTGKYNSNAFIQNGGSCCNAVTAADDDGNPTTERPKSECSADTNTSLVSGQRVKDKSTCNFNATESGSLSSSSSFPPEPPSSSDFSAATAAVHSTSVVDRTAVGVQQQHQQHLTELASHSSETSGDGEHDFKSPIAAAADCNKLVGDLNGAESDKNSSLSIDCTGGSANCGKINTHQRHQDTATKTTTMAPLAARGFDCRKITAVLAANVGDCSTRADWVTADATLTSARRSVSVADYAAAEAAERERIAICNIRAATASEIHEPSDIGSNGGSVTKPEVRLTAAVCLRPTAGSGSSPTSSSSSATVLMLSASRRSRSLDSFGFRSRLEKLGLLSMPLSAAASAAFHRDDRSPV
jgi:hypothetical protein